MKWLGYKRVRVSSIHCDAADIRRRMKAKHVIELAADVEQAGGELINALVVRASSNALLCGRDRLAASMLNKAKTVWAHILECTDQEAKERELAENIYRRADNRSDLIAELTKLRENAIWAEQQQARARGEKVSEAPQNSPKAQARKEVARAAGVSMAAVKKAEERAAAKDGEPTTVSLAPDAVPATLPEGFDTFDLEVGDFEAKQITALHGQLRGWEVTLNKLLTDLAGVDRAVAMPGTHIDRIREALRGAGHAVREAMPASLCFYCKGIPSSGDDECPACDRFGWVGRHGGDNVPAELKERGAAARVRVGGKFVLIGGAANAAEASKPAKRTKTIRVTNAEGQDVPLDDDAVAFGGE